jgi:hypothetical protein
MSKNLKNILFVKEIVLEEKNNPVQTVLRAPTSNSFSSLREQIKAKPEELF